MLTEKIDLAIIGAGPNGLLAAREAALAGVTPYVFEQRKEVGFPEHCAGLLSWKGLELINMEKLPSSVVQNPSIFGSYLFGPHGNKIALRKKEPHAVVVDRAKFDQLCAENASKKGAVIRTGFKILSAERNNGRIILIGQNDEGTLQQISAKLVISAEGVHGKVIPSILSKPPTFKKVIGMQVFVDGMTELDMNMVEVYQDPLISSSFFGWVIPYSKSKAKIGLGTTEKPAKKALDRFLELLSDRLTDASIIRKTSGVIPISGPVNSFSEDQLLSVGDIVGQTKPTTGGGVILGGYAGMLAGRIAAQAIMSNQTKRSFLKKYDRLWNAKYRNNTRLMLLLRLYLNSLSQKNTTKLFAHLMKPSIKQLIEKEGDIDEQSGIILEMLKQWSLTPFLLMLLR